VGFGDVEVRMRGLWVGYVDIIGVKGVGMISFVRCDEI
jgi:hypothetical protein